MAKLRVALQPALLGLVGLVDVAPELLSHQPHRVSEKVTPVAPVAKKDP